MTVVVALPKRSDEVKTFDATIEQINTEIQHIKSTIRVIKLMLIFTLVMVLALLLAP